jgi:hypothetical protein
LWDVVWQHEVSVDDYRQAVVLGVNVEHDGGLFFRVVVVGLLCFLELMYMGDREHKDTWADWSNCCHLTGVNWCVPCENGQSIALCGIL